MNYNNKKTFSTHICQMNGLDILSNRYMFVDVDLSGKCNPKMRY